MQDLKGKISIVMPAYNEGRLILASLEETVRTFSEFGCPWEIIVIDDGSTDDTFDKASLFSQRYPEQVIVRKNEHNMGKGHAIKEALHYISGDYVAFLDADMDLHPVQIQTLFDIMRLDRADVVIGSKLHPNSRVNYPFNRRIISFIYYLLVRLFFNLPCHDTQTGLKLFKTEVLRRILPRIVVKQFAFDLEVLVNVHHLGYHIAEAPIVIIPQRRFGRIGLRSMFETGRDTLAVFYRLFILKYYDRVDSYSGKKSAEAFARMHR